MKIIKGLFYLVIIFFCVYFFYLIIQQKNEYKIDNTVSSVVNKIQSIQKLESIQMTITKIIEGENQLGDLIPGIGVDDRINKFFFEDRLLFEVEGKVVGGFDLENFDSGYVKIDDKKNMEILLPEASVLYVELTEKSKPFERDLGILTKGDEQLETIIRNEAKKQIKQDAISGGILTGAKQNIGPILKDLFGAFEIKNININYLDVKKLE